MNHPKIMMKRFFVLALTVFTLNVANAQRDSGYVEVGFNAMRLITFGQNPQANSNTDLWNPYLFTLEGGMKNFGLRVGFSKYSYTNTQLPVELHGYARYDNDTSSADFRIGLFYNVNLEDKWTLKLGVDYFTAKTETLEKAEFKELGKDEITKETNITKETGVAPFVNLQYHISPRVSIGTELLWRISTYKTNWLATDTRTDFNVDENFEGKKNFIMAPTALFLTFRF